MNAEVIIIPNDDLIVKPNWIPRFIIMTNRKNVLNSQRLYYKRFILRLYQAFQVLSAVYFKVASRFSRVLRKNMVLPLFIVNLTASLTVLGLYRVGQSMIIFLCPLNFRYNLRMNRL